MKNSFITLWKDCILRFVFLLFSGHIFIVIFIFISFVIWAFFMFFFMFLIFFLLFFIFFFWMFRFLLFTAFLRLIINFFFIFFDNFFFFKIFWKIKFFAIHWNSLIFNIFINIRMHKILNRTFYKSTLINVYSFTEISCLMFLFFLLIRIWFITRLTSIPNFIFLFFIFFRKYRLQYFILLILNDLLILLFNSLRIQFLHWRFPRVRLINWKRMIMHNETIFVSRKSVKTLIQKPYIRCFKRAVGCAFSYWGHTSKAACEWSWVLKSVVSVCERNDCSETGIKRLLLYLVY